MNPHTLSKNQISELTKPSKSFNKHIIIATVGLLAFIVIYLTLMIWFGKLSWELFTSVSNGGSSNNLVSIISGVSLAFLSLFMIKSLFIFARRDKSEHYLITEKEEPQLFKFIHEIADEVQAPRPHKVFLTTRVNASVSYDLSLLNLLFPSKKNLEIGIGLVNVLNKGEFKAILAHEFGHFAQKSMLLGRYVYTAQQIVTRIVYKRDALDSFIRGVSSIDLRVAWIGWILSILVWAVRALIQTLFNLVSIVEKALSREMEFHADLVAVSIAGSDALIHSLDKLRAADEAYNAALAFIDAQLGDKKAVNDICTIQTNYIEKMRWVLNDETYGKSQIINSSNPANHRVFSPSNVSTPEMWSTHPADHDREENAKRTYYYKPIDEQDSWNLFSNDKKIRQELTAELVATANIETELLTDEEGIKRMNELDFSWSFLDPKYKGAYHSRYLYICFENANDIYQEKYYNNSFEKNYTDDFSEVIDKLQSIEKELKLLKMVENEVYTLEKRNISHRGKPIKRSDIPEITESLKSEENQVRNELRERDSMIRSSYYGAALKLSPSAASYHKELNQLVHYAEHSISDINDAAFKFQNTLEVVLADGKVSGTELQELQRVGRDLHDRLKAVNAKRSQIVFNSYLKQKAGGKDYSEFFEDYKFPAPSDENMDSWVNNVFGWVANASIGLNKLRNLSLEHLLDLESEISTSVANGSALNFNYSLLNLSMTKYKTLTPGSERKIQYKLGAWDRFQVGDGVIPSIAKFSISAMLIFGAVYIGQKYQETNVYYYNGLDIPVQITVNNNTHHISANSFMYEESPYENKEILVTNIEGDTIEYLNHVVSEKAKNHIYNIANSGSFIQFKVYYGYEGEESNINIGAKKWFTSNAEYILEEAPEQVYSRNERGDVKTALAGFGSEIHPNYLINVTENDADKSDLILVHANWDTEESPFIQYWLQLASQYDTTLAFLESRLDKNPTEMSSIRTKQSSLSKEERAKYCEELEKKKSLFKDKANFTYLKIRCLEDEKEKNNKFLEAYRKYPRNEYLSYAAGYILADRDDWKKSFNSLGFSLSNNNQLAQVSMLDFERIHKIASKKNIRLKKSYLEMLSLNESVKYYRELESGNKEVIGKSFDLAFYQMSIGDYQTSLATAENFGELEFFKWYVAGSNQAPVNLVNELLASDYTSSLHGNNIYIAMGVLIKNDKGLERILPKYKELTGLNSDQYETSVQFFDAIKKSDIKEAKQLLNNLDNFRIKALHQMMGYMVLGNKVKDWKVLANHLLFINERPRL